MRSWLSTFLNYLIFVSFCLRSYLREIYSFLKVNFRPTTFLPRLHLPIMTIVLYWEWQYCPKMFTDVTGSWWVVFP